MSEEQSATDKGLMGFAVSFPKKPSDGQPFKQFLGSTSGANPSGNNAVKSFMKKNVKK